VTFVVEMTKEIVRKIFNWDHYRNIEVEYNDNDVIIIDDEELLKQTTSQKFQMNAIVVVLSGWLRFKLNGKPYEIRPGVHFACPPGDIISDLVYSPNLFVRVLFFSNRFIQSNLREKMGVWNEVLYVRKLRLFHIPNAQSAAFKYVHEMFTLTIKNIEEHFPFHKEVIQSILRTGLMQLCGIMKMQLDHEMPRGTISSLFQRFLKLLSSTEVKHRPTIYYSQQLSVTPKHLSTVCKNVSGKTAGVWITEYVCNDVEYYLRSTDIPIREICSMLGFPNASFFGRYVKEHLGLPPRALRDQRR